MTRPMYPLRHDDNWALMLVVQLAADRAWALAVLRVERALEQARFDREFWGIVAGG